MGVENSADRFRGEQYYPSAEELKYRLESHYAKEEILAYLHKADASPEVLFHWPDARRGPLSDAGILRHLIAGNIDIYPFDHRLLQTNGYDVRLGEFWYLLEDPRANVKTMRKEAYTSFFRRYIPYYNPHDQELVREYWQGPFSAQVLGAEDLDEETQIMLQVNSERLPGSSFVNIRPEDKIIPVIPSTMLLCHTEEFIGGLNVISPTISGKSTAGRNLIEVCSDANLGDVGFRSRWTLEIKSKSEHVLVPLVVGEPVATIQFGELESPLQEYHGKYQLGQTLEQIKENWEPEMLLPQWRRFGE
ncbi:MAG: hypothetical protein KAV87_26100 [Desulfobacteraceae bacterium]|nr:hypothetical protein [Desulfobacteraceae bacterium]